MSCARPYRYRRYSRSERTRCNAPREYRERACARARGYRYPLSPRYQAKFEPGTGRRHGSASTGGKLTRYRQQGSRVRRISPRDPPRDSLAILSRRAGRRALFASLSSRAATRTTTRHSPSGKSPRDDFARLRYIRISQILTLTRNKRGCTWVDYRSSCQSVVIRL